MPYTEERVRFYYDHDTPMEFATGADEDLSRYHDAQDRLFTACEELATRADALCGGPEGGVSTQTLDQAFALVEQAKALLST
jgi:hypothetical protein